MSIQIDIHTDVHSYLHVDIPSFLEAKHETQPLSHLWWITLETPPTLPNLLTPDFMLIANEATPDHIRLCINTYVKYSLVVSECFPTSTPSWTWTLWYHGPWSTQIGFYSILNMNTAVLRSMGHKKGHLLHPEFQHYSTVVHGPCKGASTPSWTQTSNNVNLWTNPLKSHNCVGGVDVSTSAAKQIDSKLSNSGEHSRERNLQ